jgi:glycogen synthase
MKILIISREFPPHVVGGAGYHSYYLAKSFLKLNDEVMVYSAINNPTFKKETNLLKNSLFNIERINYFNKLAPRIWFNKKIIKELNKINLKKFDVIISHEYIEFDKIRFSGKKILKTHYNLFKKHEEFNKNKILHFLLNSFLWSFERKLEKKALFSADAIVHNSLLTQKLYREKFPDFLKKKQIVIYNGIDVKKFVFGNSKKKYFLFVGDDSLRKGLDNVIEFAKIIPGNYNVKIIGSINSKNLKKINNIKNINYIGKLKQEQLIKHYQQAQALIYPCFYEPFGNVIFESLACGTPVIIPKKNFCGASEIIPNDFCVKINHNRIKYNQEELNKASRNVIERKIKRFFKQYSWEKHCMQLKKFILN